MSLKNPPKTYQIRLMEILQFEKPSNLQHFGLRQEKQSFLRYPLLYDTFFDIGHIGSTFRDSNFG